MGMKLLPLRLLAILACLAAMPAHATSSYRYGKNEYVVITDGLAPTKKLSIAAHGSGEDGSDDFHVWLMAEPAHKRLAVLDNMTCMDNGASSACLDSGADAYNAVWSPDSRYVAVSYRTNRHMLQLNIYAIEGRRAVLVKGPSLFHEVVGREIGGDNDDFDDYRMRIFQLTWRGPNRFVITERRLFQTRDPALAGRLGNYGKELKTRTDDSQLLVGFSAEAEGTLLPGSVYKVIDLKPGKFDAFEDQ
jgi:hypothetical protein